MSPRRFALVAGGGTGGHVVPALAVARALAEVHGTEAVELVGSRRGLDAQLVRGAGVPVTLLPGRGLSRRLEVRAALDNLSAVVQLAAGVVMAVVLVVRRRPAVIVAMGGYACVPAALAGWVFGVPVVLVNVDAVPGAANRLVGRFARAAAVAFEGTPLRRSVVTGVPVREEIRRAARPDAAARAAARAELGIPAGRHVVAVVGGSLGAKRLNEAVLGLAGTWERRADVALYHVVGRRDAGWAAQLVPEAVRGEAATDGLWYRQVAYEERMPLFYCAADVVVCRAGANTVSELTVVGVPALVVPLPRSPGDHQAANAAVLERVGAAVVVEDGELSPTRLADDLGRLVGDDQLLEDMRAAASRLGRPDALAAVRALAEAQAVRGRGGARGEQRRRRAHRLRRVHRATAGRLPGAKAARVPGAKAAR